jgi:hypothetical protein
MSTNGSKKLSLKEKPLLLEKTKKKRLTLSLVGCLVGLLGGIVNSILASALSLVGLALSS